MKRWKWMLTTAALMLALASGAFAEEHGRRGNDGAYTQGYEGVSNYGRNYHRNDSYRSRDGDRDDAGHWRQAWHRDYRDHDRFRRDRDDR